MAKINPEMYTNCTFVKSLKSKPENYQSPLVPSPVKKKRGGDEEDHHHDHHH